MKSSQNLVPILQKSEFDDVATKFLEQYFPQALEEPMPVPIEEIATTSMKLNIARECLSDDLSILGQIFFSHGSAVVYLKDSDECVYREVDAGTMIIDPSVANERNIGCERNTIAHECVHWYIHKNYHKIQLLAGKENASACRCPVKQKSDHVTVQWSDEDWMEWQAHGIAPRILMPKQTFIKYVTTNLHYKNISSQKHNKSSLDLLVDDLSAFFQVSKQSASIRLKELDLI